MKLLQLLQLRVQPIEWVIHNVACSTYMFYLTKQDLLLFFCVIRFAHEEIVHPLAVPSLLSPRYALLDISLTMAETRGAAGRRHLAAVKPPCTRVRVHIPYTVPGIILWYFSTYACTTVPPPQNLNTIANLVLHKFSRTAMDLQTGYTH